MTTYQYSLTFTTALPPVGIPQQNRRIHKSATSGTAQLNADHNTQQTNPAAGQLKATDTPHASTNTASSCTIQKQPLQPKLQLCALLIYHNLCQS